MSVSKKLAELGIELPEAPAPVAAYVPAVIDRGAVRTSGQLPFQNGQLLSTGKCGSAEVNLETAKQAARQAAINALAAAASVSGGVDNLVRVIKVVGFVSSETDFYGQPGIIDGASEFFAEVFGSSHARSAVGVPVLPLDSTVEVEVEFELGSSAN